MSNGFPTFYEWLTSDTERKSDYEFSAVNNAGHLGMTADVSKIIRDHADSMAGDFDSSTDPEDITEREAEDFAYSYEYDTYEGATRSALIHWAWNSDLDITEHGPLEGVNVWDQIEHVTWEAINQAARSAFFYHVQAYITARDEWEAEQEDEQED